MLGQLLQAKLPCPNKACGSSDAYHLYDDGGHCYSCGYSDRTRDAKKGTMADYIKEEGEFKYSNHPHRGLKVDTLKHYGILTKFKMDDTPVSTYFPYTKGAGKVRKMDVKDFFAVGDLKNAHLFGKEAFPAGCSDSITITEGEYDAASVYQLTGRPAVSIRGASSARADCKAEREYLNSFKKIILCLDSDAPGQKAARDIASLFDFNKVFEVQLDPKLKDANQYLQEGLGDELKRAWWNHKRYLPEGVLSSFADFDAALDDVKSLEVLGSWPWANIQDATYGIRSGEITLVTAQEGQGKTEVIRACEHHLLATTDHNIGVVHLEEQKPRTLQGLAGLSLRQPVHLPDSNVSKDDVKKALRNLVKRDDRLHVYSHFGSDDPAVILDTIRFMAGPCECRVIFLDHITMLATSLAEVDERRTLDYISTKLGAMVNELKFHLVLISHVNDDGQTRGSRNISKICNTRIDMQRDIEAADEKERNTTKLSISKNRFASITGPAGQLFFDRATFTLNEADLEDAHDAPNLVRLPV